MTSLGVDCVPTHNIPSVVTISGWMQVTRNIGVNPACLLYKLSSRYRRLYSSPFALREPERTGKNRTRRDSSGDDYYYLLFFFFPFFSPPLMMFHSHTQTSFCIFIYLYIGSSMMHSSLRFWFRLKKEKKKKNGGCVAVLGSAQLSACNKPIKGTVGRGKKGEKCYHIKSPLSLFLCMYASLSL